MVHNQANPEIQFLNSEILSLQDKVDELWKTIKDFTKADYVKAERVGNAIRSIRREIDGKKARLAKLKKEDDQRENS